MPNKEANKPLLAVFDLDRTLWPFGMDTTDVSLPFIKNGSVVTDQNGKVITHYDEVPQVLEYLKSAGIDMAAASRTTAIKGAQQLIQLFGWEKYFIHQQIYPGCKLEHFEQFARISGLPYNSMMFFDDEKRNLIDLVKVGVNCVYVEDGVNLKLVKNAVQYFNDNVIKDEILSEERLYCEHGEF